VPPSARCMRVTIDFASSNDDAPTSDYGDCSLLDQVIANAPANPSLDIHKYLLPALDFALSALRMLPRID
jgi:hypothetical protein